ncbi:class I SAM-dependent methyltransferase [Winogradskyella alexanderae]|uniref:Class I SAM-dependent methyltransferase n=1 Tax=Winogradskyella alexanderae TaxID=2877123 RepID=A0ABS7XPP0_9FLAO|nr:class I SAM-dependent methyltransferase [Winogradskyella alexanderae]MCA0131983.1 class I SAM-dependent methyltransferase [Winogradskyella alexanderae]
MSREVNLKRLDNLKHINTSSNDYLAYLTFSRDLQNAVNEYAKGELLDIGCGNKPYEEWFNGLTSNYMGCDVVQSSSKKVDIICKANNIPLDDNSFDTIFSTQVIEHVEDIQGMLNEAYRLLRPEGIAIISGPMYWYLHEEPYDFYRFTKYGFKHIFNKSGFEILMIKENGGAWSTLGLMMNHTFSFQNPKANWVARGIKFIYRKLRLRVLVNKVFAYLDKKDYNTINTMNYVVVAKKN